MSGSIKAETKQKDMSPPTAKQVANEILKRDAKRNSKKKGDIPLRSSQIAGERVKCCPIQRYTRFHMSFIIVTAGLATMLTNWFLPRIGIHDVGALPLAISFAYAAFLTGIWLWLRHVNFAQNPPGKIWVSFAAVLAVAWLLRSMSP